MCLNKTKKEMIETFNGLVRKYEIKARELYFEEAERENKVDSGLAKKAISKATESLFVKHLALGTVAVIFLSLFGVFLLNYSMNIAIVSFVSGVLCYMFANMLTLYVKLELRKNINGSHSFID